MLLDLANFLLQLAKFEVYFKTSTYLRLVTHFFFKQKTNCGSGPEHGHETVLESVSGLILGAVRTIFRARPVGTGLGVKFKRKPAEKQMEIIIFITYSKRR